MDVIFEKMPQKPGFFTNVYAPTRQYPDHKIPLKYHGSLNPAGLVQKI